jgi:WD40 repeat protein
MLATVWKEIEVRIWDAKAYHLLGELRGHRGFISSLDFSNDNSILATGGGDHRVMIWDTNRFTLISEKEFEYPVSATVFCRENVVAALVGLSLVVVVDIRTGATVKHWQFAMPINNVLTSTYDDDVICAATSGFYCAQTLQWKEWPLISETALTSTARVLMEVACYWLHRMKAQNCLL